MRDWFALIRRYACATLPYLKVARLWPLHLPLLPLLPLLTALPFAGAGHLAAGSVVGLLLGVPLVWGMAWGYFDLLESERGDKADSLIAHGVLSRQRAFWLSVVLGLLALVDALLLGSRSTLLALVVLLLVVGYPWLRRRSYLVDGWFGIAIAMTVPLAYSAVGHWPDQVGALLALATLFWAIGWSVLLAWPHQLDEAQRGVRSLGQMFGPLTGWLVSGLQLTALLGWWMAGQHAELGSGFHAGLLVALGLMLVQGYLLWRDGVRATGQALALHLAVGAVIWLVALSHSFA